MVCSLLLVHYGQQRIYRGETFVSTALNVYQTIAFLPPEANLWPTPFYPIFSGPREKRPQDRGMAAVLKNKFRFYPGQAKNGLRMGTDI
jgi:hypothetical protein